MDIGGGGDDSGEIGILCSGEPGLRMPNMAMSLPAELCADFK